MRNVRLSSIAGILGITIAVLLVIVVLAFVVPSERLMMGDGFMSELEGDWVVTMADGQQSTVQLPVDLDVPTGESYQADYRFTQDYPAGVQLRIRSSMQTVQVLLDGEELFVSSKPQSDWIKVPEASVWVFVPVTEQLAGRTLSIRLSCPLDAFSGTINPVVIGHGDALLYDLIASNWVNLLIVLFLLVFALLSISVSFLIRKLPDNSLFFLGLFAITIGVWLFSEARLMQFITGNRFILGGISYMMLALMPMTFLLYVRSSILKRYPRFLFGMALVFSLAFPLVLLLQLTGAAAFIESAAFINVLTGLAVVIVLAFAIRDAVVHKSRLARNFLLISSVLSLTVLIEISNFLFRNYNYTSQISRIGIVVFFVFLASSSIRMVNRLIDEEKEAQFLRELAYRDFLTGAGNRLAFERDLDARIDSSEPGHVFRLILMDINNLKPVNDAFGHLTGDQAIQLCHDAIIQTIRDSGTCYRMGGDEFACIVEDSDDGTFQKTVDQIHEKLRQATAQLPFKLEMAIGSDRFTTQDARVFDNFYHHVDQLMYSKKKQMKLQSENE